ncbi:hypothetical protein FA95DRAFT_1560682 [Auriscalpium vulgare]|uniref:Uncharacterized protein n=1 Tax=Auriscalpium vulgare TaxID=40419 RepID=A0ACB8RP69_9AGAM|nr:hypothetical protein FA95DRAFT_1560682 [Auriscalpium vulgare]
MEHESGDAYLRRIAAFIRTNEPRLAEAGFQRRRRPRKPTPEASTASAFNPLTWFGGEPTTVSAPASRPKPLVFTTDTHRLFYILMRLEALGCDVGSLDVKVDRPSRPMNYVELFPASDTSETLSLTSIRTSFSAVSRLSLGVGLWGRPEPLSVDQELKYIFSSFTKIPALALHSPGPKKIAELANEPPNENALPLDAFRNLQSLECVDIDPRTLLGWDRLAEVLWSLTIRRSGLDDVTDVFVDAVLEDQKRREGGIAASRRRSIHGMSRQSSFYGSRLPESISEDSEESTPISEDAPRSALPETTPPLLPSSKWAFLRHLSLADNALTFLPSTPLPYLTSITHLDLSSNLLVSVPPGLSSLYNLVSLNLSDNMIDSVLGIYKHMGSVLTLNLARNRLDSLCGLERLMALERVDVRHNLLEESGEVGRLAPLPNVTEVWVDGNPFTELEDGFRVKCFDHFWREGKAILLDGTPAGYYEKMNLTTAPPEQMSSSRPLSSASSPPIVPVGLAAVSSPSAGSASSSPAFAPSSSSHNASPYLAPAANAGRQRKRKPKRIVDLDGGSHSPSFSPPPPAPPTRSPVAVHPALPAPAPEDEDADMTPRPSALRPPAPAPPKARPHTKHRRSQTEAVFSSSPEPEPEPALLPLPLRPAQDRQRSASLKWKSAARRARASASVFEAGAGSGADDLKEADAFRARIEALRSDMGEGWLKVLSQSQLGQAGVQSG